MEIQKEVQDREKKQKESDTLSDSSLKHEMDPNKKVSEKQNNGKTPTKSPLTKQYFKYFLQGVDPRANDEATQPEKESNKDYPNKFPLSNMGSSLTERNQQIIEKLTQESEIEGLCIEAALLQESYRQQMEEDLLRSKRFTKLDTFRKDLTIHKIDPSRHYQIVKLEVQMLWYKTEITILNESEKSPLNQHIKAFGTGTYGQVYLVDVLGEKMAIKSIKLEQNGEGNCQKADLFQKVLTNAIKEYFFVLLFSQLRIGPKAKNIGGFDMVMYEGFIDFATEICEIPNHKERYTEQIAKNLFKMHILQIAHRDIKPANILYSEEYKKQVFIDFGCTEILEETFGYKSLTSLAGTRGFMSEQVFNLKTTEKGEVDLYYNDLHGLLTSMDKKKEVFQLNPKKIYEMKDSLLQEIPLKFLLYNKNFEAFYQSWKSLRKTSPDNDSGREFYIMRFIPETVITAEIRNFYQIEIDDIVKDADEFGVIKVLIRNRKSPILHEQLSFPFKQQIGRHLKQVYSVIKIKYGLGGDWDNQINLILATKANVERFIKIHRQKLIRQETLSKNIELQKQVQQNITIHQQMLKICIVVANYSSMSQNLFNATFQQKVEACKLVQEIMQRRNYSNYRQFTQFVSNKQNIQQNSLLRFYQFYITKMVRYLPMLTTLSRSSQMVNSISTLLILGYPRKENFLYFLVIFFYQMSQSIDIETEQNNCVNLHSQKLLAEKVQKKIVVFLTILMKYLFLKQVLSNPYVEIFPDWCQKQRFRVKINQQFQKDLQPQTKVLQQNDQQIKQFFDLCFRTQKTMHLSRIESNPFQQLLKQIMSPKIIQISKQYKNEKLWELMLIYVLFKKNFIVENTIRSRLEEKLLPSLRHANQIFYFQIFYYILSIQRQNYVLNLSNHLIIQKKQIYEKIDFTINNRQISLKYNVIDRIDLYLKRKDYDKALEIAQLINKDCSSRETTTNLVSFISKLIQRFYTFFRIQYLKSAVSVNFQIVQILAVYRPIIILALKFAKQQINNPLIKKNRYSIEFFRAFPKQFQNQFIQVRDILRLFLNLIKVVRIYQQVQLFINSNLVFNSNQLQLSSKIKLNHQDLISFQQLEQQTVIFCYYTTLMELIVSNEDVKQLFKKNSLLKCSLLHILQNLINFSKPKFGLLEQVCNSVFEIRQNDPISIPELYKKFTSITRVLAYIIIRFKGIHSSQFFQQTIKLFNFYKKQCSVYNLVIEYIFLYQFIKGFLAFQKPYFQLFEVLNDCTRILKEFFSIQIVSFLIFAFKKAFWQSKQFFTKQGKDWRLHDFGEFINANINILKPSQNPYMSLVCDEFISTDVIRDKNTPIYPNLIVFILKSIPHMNSYVQQLLLPKMYFMILFASNDKKLEMDRGTLYRYLKSKKNESNKNRTLNQAIQSMFIKEKIAEKIKFPYLIKQLYSKKLAKFFKVKQNYKEQSDFRKFNNSILQVSNKFL